MDKEKVSNTVDRVVLILQQRNFTADETKALIKCLEELLKVQMKKHGVTAQTESGEGLN